MHLKMYPNKHTTYIVIKIILDASHIVLNSLRVEMYTVYDCTLLFT